jgi:hypothetical protein
MAQHVYELKFKPKRPNGKIQDIPKALQQVTTIASNPSNLKALQSNKW